MNEKLKQIEALADDLVLEFTANIPIFGPNREWDPNDEFKRCAIDRRERVVKFRRLLREIIESEEVISGAAREPKDVEGRLNELR